MNESVLLNGLTWLLNFVRACEVFIFLCCSFDREHFVALLVSGDVDGAEEYLSVFTTQDSNYYSNLMFYFVKRQRFFKFLVE